MTGDARFSPIYHLTAWLDEFLLDCEARRLSVGTLAFYQAKLPPFLAWLYGQQVHQPEEITTGHVRAYLADMQRRGLRPHTQLAAARAIKTWLRFLVREGLLAESPMARMQMPRVDVEPLPAFTQAQVELLLSSCRTARDRAIILCLLDTGMRSREFIALAVEDVDIRSGSVQIQRGKTRKARTVYIGAKARRALTRYLRERSSMAGTDPLWVVQEGGRPLQLSGLRELLRRLGQRAGVAHCHPHTFRRTFALWSLRSGMDIYTLQRLMGHADLTMLQRYLALVEQDLQEAHRKFGPVDRTL